MKMAMHRIVQSSVMAVLLTLAAVAEAGEMKPMVKLGYDTGGDTLVTVIFVDGDRESIKANEGFYFGGGLSFVSDDKIIETEVSLAYKFQFIDASNGDVTWSRFPLEGLVFYRFPKVRLGGGVTYHLNPDLSGSGVISGLNVDFDNAFGAILQADYRLTDKLNLGARYTMLDY